MNVNAIAGDSRDSAGRGRFYPTQPQHYVMPGIVDDDFWYWTYAYYKSEKVNTDTDPR